MTIEEKKLLLKDLCARLPYGIRCCVYNNEQNRQYYGREKFDITLNIDNICDFLGQNGALEYIDIKPYLRPLSSMTEKEQRYIWDTYGPSFLAADFEDVGDVSGLFGYCRMNISKAPSFTDWLNAHQFDYRITSDGKTMIEAGLALEAPEGMY